MRNNRTKHVQVQIRVAIALLSKHVAVKLSHQTIVQGLGRVRILDLLSFHCFLCSYGHVEIGDLVTLKSHFRTKSFIYDNLIFTDSEKNIFCMHCNCVSR